jgi:hypothetical protein
VELRFRTNTFEADVVEKEDVSVVDLDLSNDCFVLLVLLVLRVFRCCLSRVWLRLAIKV